MYRDIHYTYRLALLAGSPGYKSKVHSTTTMSGAVSRVCIFNSRMPAGPFSHAVSSAAAARAMLTTLRFWCALLASATGQRAPPGIDGSYAYWGRLLSSCPGKHTVAPGRMGSVRERGSWLA
ncbi:hypothetical protein EPA93_27560 [Ktedonosporobacter rubrisoli]|uniref:Uncharacterized protein n=1 Tax=Ktedonosporobacter rubrisoli TaxID=2509675 RepID=A0A4P6JVH7_KTERU|nr:hypothetical protein [Ktedonosporobacter rubrisoli]QBD79534.1 hypothetical protein EPA93_27560 [Ktedonosporobacter rubrisoli]